MKCVPFVFLFPRSMRLDTLYYSLISCSRIKFTLLQFNSLTQSPVSIKTWNELTHRPFRFRCPNIYGHCYCEGNLKKQSWTGGLEVLSQIKSYKLLRVWLFEATTLVTFFYFEVWENFEVLFPDSVVIQYITLNVSLSIFQLGFSLVDVFYFWSYYHIGKFSEVF